MGKKIVGDFEVKDLTDAIGPLIGILAFGFAGYLQVNYTSKKTFDEYKKEQKEIIKSVVTQTAFDMQIDRFEEKLTEQKKNLDDAVSIVDGNRESLHRIEVALAKIQGAREAEDAN